MVNCNIHLIPVDDAMVATQQADDVEFGTRVEQRFDLQISAVAAAAPPLGPWLNVRVRVCAAVLSQCVHVKFGEFIQNFKTTAKVCKCMEVVEIISPRNTFEHDCFGCHVRYMWASVAMALRNLRSTLSPARKAIAKKSEANNLTSDCRWFAERKKAYQFKLSFPTHSPGVAISHQCATRTANPPTASHVTSTLPPCRNLDSYKFDILKTFERTDFLTFARKHRHTVARLHWVSA